MRILVFGAAGNVGRRVVAEALSRGHEVTAVVRDPSGFPNLPAAVEARLGNAASVEDAPRARRCGATGRPAADDAGRARHVGDGAVLPRGPAGGVRPRRPDPQEDDRSTVDPAIFEELTRWRSEPATRAA
ncbi:MAG: NAD(P)H-binding protein [Marmoricola sp.]